MVKSRSLGRRAVVAVRGKPRERTYCTSSRTFYICISLSIALSIALFQYIFRWFEYLGIWKFNTKFGQMEERERLIRKSMRSIKSIVR